MSGCMNNFPQFQGQVMPNAQPVSACTLAPPRSYQACCSPSPLHRSSCQSSAYFNLNTAYGRY